MTILQNLEKASYIEKVHFWENHEHSGQCQLIKTKYKKRDGLA